MKKELIDKAWACLPREFREEVKRLYREFTFTREGYYAELFGKHNLTSDAEGEEMLTVSRKRVQEFYAKCKEVTKNPYSYPDYSHESALSRMALLDILFGSKCLPDDGDELSPEPKPAEIMTEERYQYLNSLSLEDYDNETSADEQRRFCDYQHKYHPDEVQWVQTHSDDKDPKPAEPKFKVGDKVRLKDVYEIEEINEEQTMVGLKGCAYMEDIDNLEPYTEPEGNIAENHNLSQHCDKSSDNPQSDKTKASTNHFGDSNEMVNDSEASLTKVPPNPSLI